MKAIFTIRPGVLGGIITHLDKGQYNHCGIYEPATDGRGSSIIEANPFEGVRKRFLGPVLNSGVGFSILELGLPNEEDAMKWLRQQVGKKYDWRGLIGVSVGADWSHEEKWFCTALTLMTFIQAGATLDGSAQPQFDYVVGVRDAYDTLVKLGAAVVTSYDPKSVPHQQLKR